MPRDFYDTLGVAKTATEAEIKKAYRKLARKYHPDVNPGDASSETRFKEVQSAYDILSDPKKKQLYDQVGHDNFMAGVRSAGEYSQQPGPGGGIGDIFGGGFSWPGAQGGTGGYQTSSEVSDLFRQLFEQGFGTATSWGGSPFGSAARRKVRQKGADKQHQVSLSFEDAYHGKELTLQDRQGQRVKARIPAGVETGAKVRVAGHGEDGLNGGPPGDLILHVLVQDHPYFVRKGSNIHITVPLTFAEAALSATIEVPTMDGRVQMKVPAGTPSGKEFRLRGKGFPHGALSRGDQIVRVEIVTPQSLDLRSRELLREFAERNPQNPRLGLWE